MNIFSNKNQGTRAIFLQFNSQRNTLGQMTALEKARTWTECRDAISPFVVDREGRPVEPKEARKLLDGVVLADLKTVIAGLLMSTEMDVSGVTTPR
ncbi:MAG: hypothetical protein WCF84_10355 [Anaerolineae bacterium]